MTSVKRDLLLLAAAFLLSLPLVTPRIYASDEVQYFRTCDRSGSIVTSRSRTSTGISTRPA